MNFVPFFLACHYIRYALILDVIFTAAAAKESGVASDALSEDDFGEGLDDDDIDDDEEEELEEEEENTDFIEITDDDNVGGGVSKPRCIIARILALKWDTCMTFALKEGGSTPSEDKVREAGWILYYCI